MLAIGWLLAFTVRGQAVSYQVSILDSRKGLSNSSVNQLFQDSDNLLWVATWDGLNLYNGTGFNVFNYTINDNRQSTIGNNIVEDIIEDRFRNIWISTVEGVSRFDKNKGVFSNFFYNARPGNPPIDRQFQFLLDNHQQLFCFSIKRGILAYRQEADSFVNINIGIDPGEIKQAAFDSKGILWILQPSGKIRQFLPQGSQFKEQTLLRTDYTFNKLFFIPEGLFATDRQNRLFRFDVAHAALRQLASLPAPMRDMKSYRGHYLFARADQGYYVLDSNFRTSAFLQNEWGFLRNMPINIIHINKDQSLWCGTDGNGIVVLKEQYSPFKLISNQSIGFSNNKQVRGFLIVNGKLWVATKGNGILLFNRQKADSSWRFERIIETGDSSLAGSQAVYCMGEVPNDYIIIGTDGSGILLYDKLQKQFYPWNKIGRSKKLPNFSSIYSIQPLKDGSICLGSSGYGLLRFKINRSEDGPALDSFTQYSYTGNDAGPANNIIYDLQPLNNRYLALACRHGGLSIFDLQQQRFNNTIRASDDEAAISNNDILSLYLDKKQTLWIGTSFGLNSISLQSLLSPSPRFITYTEKNGLPSNTVHGITEDGKGLIWITTNKGIVRIHPGRQLMLKMSDRDGLQSNEFSDGSIWKDTSGTVYFGGVYGFNYGNPDAIKTNTVQPNLLVSNFRLGTGEQQDKGFWILTPSGENRAKDVEAERSDDFFELQLKAIDFQNADKCEFAYRLEGADNDWRYAGTNGAISYSNLSPGNYTLQVKWSNGESGWTSPVTALYLQVKPFFLLTLPAFLFYYLIAATAFYIIYTNRKEKQRIKQQLVLEQKLRAREDALHEERINFFTNIAHELQTPLTLVNGSLERYEHYAGQTNLQAAASAPPDAKRFLHLVRQQASRLSYLVQQLMEFRSVEGGKSASNGTLIDFSGLLVNIIDLFALAYPDKKMQVNQSIESGITGYADLDKLEKVLYNLLSNAFKHGKNGETISIELKKSEDLVNISVANSGVALTQEEANRLFDLFFTKSDSRQSGFSTGIGLAFTRQLTEAMGGNIHVESREGWLHFFLEVPCLPAGGPAPENEEAIDQPSDLLQSMLESPATGLQPGSDAANKSSWLQSIDEPAAQTVLVVEDDPGMRFLLRDILKHTYTVFEADNGKDGLGWLAHHSCDCIISDIMMPVMSGLEFCEQVKQTAATCHIPVILLTARTNFDQQTEGYEAGADAYIAKPFNGQHLMVRIKTLLEGRRRMKEAFSNNAFALPQDETYQDEEKHWLSLLVKFVEDQLDNIELGAVDLEKFTAMSKMQLYRKLKTLTSMSPGEFIRNLRLQKAAQLLKQTNLTVSEIFYQTGFNNQSYFFREFRKQFGQSPGEYREQYRVKA